MYIVRIIKLCSFMLNHVLRLFFPKKRLTSALFSTKYRNTTSSRIKRTAACRGYLLLVCNNLYSREPGISLKSSPVKSSCRVHQYIFARLKQKVTTRHDVCYCDDLLPNVLRSKSCSAPLTSKYPIPRPLRTILRNLSIQPSR